ncbi:hypothetical protein ABFS82_07G067800 [Erythranthe guttata]|uniref:putative late blight resistance protein homolog R1B-14 n=1 Tax=Erythranthe guttata TaxID=4155 RepID=UPI00064E0122|nr:PREDICTED: putative late blight resistance protein homolog R1B-14 [Erythranthe guttata]|eukprot:XP_012844530.1 PREDICTED: putative late blight resistance protein homolog R1B-14 [Erythranthe guttata]
MVGFDDNLMAIKDKLCGNSSKLQVIPIVGMGGIGKTTLATKAYHDPSINENFNVRAWVTLSQDSSKEKVSSSLVCAMENFVVGRSNESNEVKVFQALKGRKYLLVLDDIWSTKAWDDIMMMFPDDNNKSRIILTTRLSDVAAYPDSCSHLHEMDLLDDDQSWNLLRQNIFNGKEDYPLELEIIGKEIARSCGGLPLAIVVIAGVLSKVDNNRASWEKIARNVKSTIAKEENGKFEEILSLSYNHLPRHLRPCFLYMGGFPEDYDINIPRLVKLWVAEEFIHDIRPSSVSRSLEEVAEEEYLADLVKRNLVMVTERKSDGRIKTCRVHDLMRELCIRISRKENFLVHVTDKGIPVENLRRIFINRNDLNCLANIYRSTTRTVICFMELNKDSYKDLTYFRFMRIICILSARCDMSDCIASLCVEDFNLFNIRYLAFPYPTKIPPTISNLLNLQALIIHESLNECKQSLPTKIWTMKELRHLICYRFGELPNPPDEGASSGYGLENLQTLWEVTNLICTENILEMIPNVKELGICYTIDNREKEYELDNLVRLKQLERFKLTLSYPLDVWKGKNITLAFPKTLKWLSFGGWSRPWSEMTIVGSLPNLQVLKIKENILRGETWETVEGEFLELKHLMIKGSKLERWVTESNHFPKLERLLIHQCLELRNISNDIGEISTLELIEVKSGLKSTAEWAERIQREQRDYRYDVTEVRCLNCIHELQS